MTDHILQVPDSLLLNPDLPASAKVTWMVARLLPESVQTSTATLARASGLAKPTVRRSLTRLRITGWDLAAAPASGAMVPVPVDLLTSTRLSAQARVLYGILLLTPGFSHPGGSFAHVELADLARTSVTTIIKALAQLARAEWITLSRRNRLAPIRFDLTFPGFARGLKAMDAAQHRLQQPGHFGEMLMREYLTLLVDSDNFQDNVYPGFLVNPRTQALLQFDRFYPPNVAFEFNGPYHDESAVQQERDLIKRGICYTRGIALVTIQDADLTLGAMRQKVENLLPMRDLTGYDLLIDYLESETRRYLRKVAKC